MYFLLFVTTIVCTCNVISVMASDDPVDLLVAAIMSDQVQFERMQEWCDTYPARVSGSQALEGSF